MNWLIIRFPLVRQQSPRSSSKSALLSSLDIDGSGEVSGISISICSILAAFGQRVHHKASFFPSGRRMAVLLGIRRSFESSRRGLAYLEDFWQSFPAQSRRIDGGLMRKSMLYSVLGYTSPKLLVAFALLICSVHSQARGESNRVLADVSSDSTISLLTLGADQHLYSAAGHALVRLKSKSKDLILNWGIFDFEDTNFYWRYYHSQPKYRFAWLDTRQFLKNFGNSEPRYLREDVLAFNQSQKASFINLVQPWFSSEHQTFIYDEFRHNCSTIIRDLINQTVEGRFKHFADHIDNNETWRTYWQKYFSWHSLTFVGLDPIFNHEFDQRITGWHEMFIPQRLSYYLNQARLVDSSRLIVDRPYIKKGWLKMEYVLWLVFGLPLVLLMLPAKSNRSDGPGQKRLVILGYLILLWSLFATIYGSVIAINSILTERSYIQFSAAIWLIWPIDVLFLGLAIPWIKGRSSRVSLSSNSLYTFLTMAHLLGCFCYVLLVVLGLIIAEGGSIALAILPISAMLYGTCYFELRAFKPMMTTALNLGSVQK